MRFFSLPKALPEALPEALRFYGSARLFRPARLPGPAGLPGAPRSGRIGAQSFAEAPRRFAGRVCCAVCLALALVCFGGPELLFTEQTARAAEAKTPSSGTAAGTAAAKAAAQKASGNDTEPAEEQAATTPAADGKATVAPDASPGAAPAALPDASPDAAGEADKPDTPDEGDTADGPDEAEAVDAPAAKKQEEQPPVPRKTTLDAGQRLLLTPFKITGELHGALSGLDDKEMQDMFCRFLESALAKRGYSVTTKKDMDASRGNGAAPAATNAAPDETGQEQALAEASRQQDAAPVKTGKKGKRGKEKTPPSPEPRDVKDEKGKPLPALPASEEVPRGNATAQSLHHAVATITGDLHSADISPVTTLTIAKRERMHTKAALLATVTVFQETVKNEAYFFKKTVEGIGSINARASSSPQTQKLFQEQALRQALVDLAENVAAQLTDP